MSDESLSPRTEPPTPDERELLHELVPPKEVDNGDSQSSTSDSQS